MKQGHLATATFWVGLLSLFGWGASAQIPRPPMPIPAHPPVVALMPPTVPLTRSQPTPIPTAPVVTTPARPAPPLTPATMPLVPLHVALPPAEYDHEYKGKLTVLKEDNYVFIRHVCSDTKNPIACSFRTYDDKTGETLSCLIMLGPDVWDDERVMKHERAHCNGWPGDHPGARYGD
jgi:hypothetical protein